MLNSISSLGETRPEQERLFRFYGILGQPREVHPKFRNEIPENVCSIRPQTGISGIFGRMESAPCPLGTIRYFPREKFLRKPNNKSFIDQVSSFKMA